MCEADPASSNRAHRSFQNFLILLAGILLSGPNFAFFDRCVVYSVEFARKLRFNSRGAVLRGACRQIDPECPSSVRPCLSRSTLSPAGESLSLRMQAPPLFEHVEGHARGASRAAAILILFGRDGPMSGRRFRSRSWRLERACHWLELAGREGCNCDEGFRRVHWDAGDLLRAGGGRVGIGAQQIRSAMGRSA